MKAVELCNEHVRRVENFTELTNIQNTLDWSAMPKVEKTGLILLIRIILAHLF
jgi:hypothetical protein